MSPLSILLPCLFALEFLAQIFSFPIFWNGWGLFNKLTIVTRDVIVNNYFRAGSSVAFWTLLTSCFSRFSGYFRDKPVPSAIIFSVMEQERDFTLDRSRYYRPPLDGHIGDLCTDDLELSAYGEAVIDRHCFPEMTSFKDRQWHCFLCPASFHSPWSLTDHVIQLHPEEHAFFLENNPDHLTKCPIDG